MTTQHRFFTSPHLWRLLCGLTLAVAQFFSPAGVGTAQAATTTCTPNGATQDCTVTFEYSGAPESWTVPADVTSATFDLYGAQGGGNGSISAGGLGGAAQATFAVTPGQIFQINVGGQGSSADPGSLTGPGRPGGFGGGGTGGNTLPDCCGGGAGGGGASDVRNGNFALSRRLIVAAGGGGSGASGGSGSGGGGGETGINGTNAFLNVALGGGGGSQTAGGAGGAGQSGAYNGTSGGLGIGGAGGLGAGGGGGGGGGYYGGGGGGSVNIGVGSGGGGGGSSYGPAGVIFQTGVRAGNGLVIITYSQLLPDTTGPVAHPTLSPAPNAAGWNNTNVTVNWNWTDDLSGVANGFCETSSTSDVGVGAQTLTAFCTDEAGNLSQASYTVQVDRAAPLIRSTVSPPTISGSWSKQAVMVSFTCQEQGALSGLATDTVGGNVTFSSEGTNFTATNTGTCVDFADNVATAVTAGPFKIDLTKPTISAAATTPANANGWYNSDVIVRFTCADNLSGIVTCPADQTLSGEGTALSSTAQTVADRALNSSNASNIVTVKIDKTAPSVTLTGVTEGATYPFGSVPPAACSTTDALSGVATQATLNTTGGNPDGSGNFTATCSGATDLAGNSAAAVSVSYSVTPPTDTTAPIITPQVNGTLGSNGWYVSNVTVSWTVVDNESTISSQSGCETQNITGDTSGVTFTCSASSAGGSSSESVTIQHDATTPVVTVTGVSAGGNYTLGSVPTAACSTTDALSGVATQATVSITGGNPDGTGNFTATCSSATDVAGNSTTAVSISYTVSAAADACTTTALRDDFNRANGSLGSNWAGLTGQSFYKLANNKVDVQLGGPVVWKPTTFGVNQAAFVTLNTVDAKSPAQGVLLKVQTGTIPNAGAIAVVYDSRAKAVRVSTLRLNTPAWTTYGNTPATFANGDKLLGCIQADGTVRVYQNTTLLTTVTLNSADQSFFNAKGGKIGLWTVAALNAVFDDFGGGALTGVTGAALDAPAVPDELADDGAEITVAEDFPTDDTAAAPDAGSFVNRLFLPLVTR